MPLSLFYLFYSTLSSQRNGSWLSSVFEIREMNCSKMFMYSSLSLLSATSSLNTKQIPRNAGDDDLRYSRIGRENNIRESTVHWFHLFYLKYSSPLFPTSLYLSYYFAAVAELRNCRQFMKEKRYLLKILRTWFRLIILFLNIKCPMIRAISISIGKIQSFLGSIFLKDIL